MSFAFDRPVGAAADVKELEYVSALHQTEMPNIRKDGSINADDISLFLASRFRIFVTPDKVRETILAGLGGGEEEDECIDLMEIVAMLLIPSLIKAADEVLEGDVKKVSDEDTRPMKGLLNYVVKMILHDITDSVEPKKLDVELLAEIFNSYGEKELAEESNLLNEMIELASEGAAKDVETPMLMLDTKTFARALTNDVLIYDVENEFSTETVISETFGDFGEKKSSNMFVAAIKDFFSFQWLTAPIDIIADTSRSLNLVTCLWAVFTLFFFIFNSSNPFVSTDQCPREFVQSEWRSYLECYIISNVLLWIVKVLVVGIIGWMIVCLPNIGNFAKSKTPIYTLVGLLFGILFIVNPDIAPGQTDLAFISICTIILFILGIFFHIVSILNYLTPSSLKANNPKLASALESDTIKAEVKMKRAASYKVQNMIRNAIEITQSTEGADNVMDTYFGQALLGFSKAIETTEKSGGFVWTIKNMWNGKIFTQEGLWLSAKTRANSLTMIIISFFILWVGITLTDATVKNLGKENIQAGVEIYINNTLNVVGETIISFTESGGDVNASASAVGAALSSFLIENAQTSSVDCSAFSDTFAGMDTSEILSSLSCEGTSCSLFETDLICVLNGLGDDSTSGVLSSGQLQVLQAVGFDINNLMTVMKGTLFAAISNAVNKLYPSNFNLMIYLPAITYTVVSTLVAFLLAAVYIPSSLTTTLKLRSGVIPTFNDPTFSFYRKSPDQISLLSGSVFWGTVIAALLLGLLAAIAVFFMFWQVTRGIVIKLLATVIGVVATLTFKSILLILYRCRSFKAFYRRIPGSQSFILVFLEAADFALSIYFSIIRLIKLIVISLLYAGRIDTPLLAPSIPNAADSMPQVFIKEILLREAHRHPYISLMGTFYMLKLKHGSKFVNRAGSAWRLMFVYALFPWLSKYRIHSPEEEKKTDREIDLTSEFHILRSDFSMAKNEDTVAEHASNKKRLAGPKL